MAVEINQNRSTLFSFRSTDNPTTAFSRDPLLLQYHEQKAARNALVIEVIGGELEISLDGGSNPDILVKPADGFQKYEGLQFSSISFRRKGGAAITSFRILAW